MLTSLNCYACKTTLTTKNESFEHILPNSIGGKVKSRKLLCRKCNNGFGEKFEADFANELSIFSGRLPIKRDRGENRKLKTVDKLTGLPLIIDNHGMASLSHVVVLEKPDPNSGGCLKFISSNPKQSEGLVQHYCDKFPNAKVEMSTCTNEISKIKISGRIGSLSFFKTAQKCLLNLYIHKGGDRAYIEEEVKTLFTTEKLPSIWYFSNADTKKLNTQLIHVLAVFGKPEEKLLFGYIGLFGGALLHNYLIV